MSEEKRVAGPVTKGATSGAALGGAAALIIVWGLGLLGIDAKQIEGPLAVILASLLPVLGAWLGGWLVKPGPGSRRA